MEDFELSSSWVLGFHSLLQPSEVLQDWPMEGGERKKQPVIPECPY